MKTYSLDTESTYETGRDIRSLGVANYVRHPETDHYLVGLYSDDFAWVGHPKDAPWHLLAGNHVTMHNQSYDLQVVEELRRRGLAIPAFHHDCTADCAAFLQSPRSLADAGRELLGVELDKSVRDEMKGKRFEDQTPENKVRWGEYCLLDTKMTYHLWQHHSHKWPEHERAVSRHTAMIGARGIGVDLSKVTQGIELLKQTVWEAEQEIPWAGELTAKGKDIPATSPLALAAECRRLGIEPPATTEEKSEIFQDWLDANAERAPFVRAVGQWRKANRLLKVLEAMQARTVEGRLRYSLKFFGAVATGRWSGDAGLNLQNLPRAPFCGVDARGCLVPGPGKKLIVADLSQIEPRVLHWLTGNTRLLDMVRNGLPIYEAYSRVAMGWTGGSLKKENPALYQQAKVVVLGLGYGAGAAQFQRIAKVMGGLDLTEPESKRMVDQFRRANRQVVGLWDKLDRSLRDSWGGDFVMELPSGRSIRYMGVAASGREITARTELGGTRYRWWGSKLCENLCQATARDVFADMVLRLEAAGLPVVLHCHDEAVLEVDENAADDALRTTLEIMSTAPEWAEGLPVAAEAKVLDCYGK